MRIYISGPITGYPDGNRDAFRLAAKYLEASGQEVVNPRDIPATHDGPCIGPIVEGHSSEQSHRYACHLRADLLALFDCDAIFMLEGWEESKGAVAEFWVAKALRLVIINADA